MANPFKVRGGSTLRGGHTLRGIPVVPPSTVEYPTLTLLGVPLAVRLKTTRKDVFVSREVRDLSFRSSVPGGFSACEMTLDRPLSVDADEIRQYGEVYVYDGRSGATIWQGRLEDPGRAAGSQGELWSVTAIGPSAHARDRTVPVVYIDKSMRNWIPQGGPEDTKKGTAQVTQDASANPALKLKFDRGVVFNPFPSSTTFAYRAVNEAGQKLARVDYNWLAGVPSDTQWYIETVYRTTPTGASAQIPRQETLSSAPSGLNPKVVVTDWTNGRDVVEFRLHPTTSTTVVNDSYYVIITDITVIAVRLNKDGTEKTTGYSANSVLASDVVADLLGRLLTDFDGANATVTTTSYAITQCAYPGGATAEEILKDLMGFEQNYYWAVWEDTSLGKSRFEWVAWPSTIRYEASAKDGFDSPGSAVDLFNAVSVRWVDVDGRVRKTRRTQTVQVLTDAGLTREAFIDLGDELSSSANADRVGDEFLGQHAIPPSSGTLDISTPILDGETGRMVHPWEIRPGELIRVRDVQPRASVLSATARDGVTIFRIVGVQYDARNNQATLNLDEQPRTLGQLVSLAMRRN